MTVYEIESQKPGVHQSRWLVSDPELPNCDKERAEELAATWASDGVYEYRVVAFEMTRTAEFPWIAKNRVKEAK